MTGTVYRLDTEIRNIFKHQKYKAIDSDILGTNYTISTYNYNPEYYRSQK